MHPVPRCAESARQVDNESLLAQSDGRPAGPPPKNPSGRAVPGALRIGSGEARVQSTVPAGIINPSKHDSLSRISGQLTTTAPIDDRRRAAPIVMPHVSEARKYLLLSDHLIQSLFPTSIDANRSQPCITHRHSMACSICDSRRLVSLTKPDRYCNRWCIVFQKKHMARKCGWRDESVSRARGSTPLAAGTPDGHGFHPDTGQEEGLSHTVDRPDV